MTAAPGHEPAPPFRHEPPVRLGRVEIHHTVSIGAHTYLNDHCFVRSGVHIGRYCSIGRRVTIGSGTHDHHALTTSPALPVNSRGDILRRADPAAGARVVVGHDVWIGDNAYINSGVSVGHGAVIAAGAIVTRDVEPYAIVRGVPAERLQWRFEDERLRARLLDTRWWDYPAETLRVLDVADPAGCLDIIDTWSDSDRSPCPWSALTHLQAGS